MPLLTIAMADVPRRRRRARLGHRQRLPAGRRRARPRRARHDRHEPLDGTRGARPVGRELARQRLPPRLRDRRRLDPGGHRRDAGGAATARAPREPQRLYQGSEPVRLGRGRAGTRCSSARPPSASVRSSAGLGAGARRWAGARAERGARGRAVRDALPARSHVAGRNEVRCRVLGDVVDDALLHRGAVGLRERDALHPVWQEQRDAGARAVGGRCDQPDPVCSAGPGCEQPTAISPLVLLGAAGAAPAAGSAAPGRRCRCRRRSSSRRRRCHRWRSCRQARSSWRRRSAPPAPSRRAARCASPSTANARAVAAAP